MKTPDSVDRQALIDAFATLDLDITSAMRVIIEPTSVTLTYAARDSAGRKYLAANGDIATVVVRVGTL